MQNVYLNKYDKKFATVYQNYYRAKDLEESELTSSELTYAEYADWRDEHLLNSFTQKLVKMPQIL